MNLPTLPEGWPIGSYGTYREAQRAVGHLADSGFPVRGVTIVGVEPMLVERVAGRLTRARALRTGAVSGLWLGAFIALLLSLLPAGSGLLPIVIGMVSGVGFGLGSAALKYASAKGQRGFVSQSQLVASRYDVLCQPRNAESGKNLLAALAMKAPLPT